MLKNDTRRMRATDIAVALGLLTRLPVRSDGARGARAGWAWPLAGAVVAFFATAAGWIAYHLGLPEGFAAALTLMLLIVQTGAMHEDGLADCADGFWGGWSTGRRLEIMKDSRIGAYGVIALAISLIARWSLLVTLLQAQILWGPVIAAAAISRVPMLMLMRYLPSARSGGLSERTGVPDQETVVMANVLALLVALVATGFVALLAALAVAATAFGFSKVALSKIGGQTGDVLGAVQQMSEIAALAIFAAILA
jgi:adenosylcobinamide-GDP ribazoletransferase